MNPKELEQNLKQSLEHTVPDDFERILSHCDAQKGTVISMTQSTSKKKKWISIATAACLALVIIGGGSGYYYKINHTVASVVSLDVNPSVELTVNRKEKVISATPMNEDGTVILEGLNLEGTQVTVAMNAIIGSLLQHGYVDELANSILITVEDDDAQRGEKLQTELTEQADAVLANAQINAAILSQTFQHNDALTQKAAEYGISAGKAALIQAIVEESNGTKTFESLVGLTINELNLLYTAQSASYAFLESSTGETAPAATAIVSTGSASQNAYIGAEAAQDVALDHASLSASKVSFLKTEYDYDDGRMVYEVSFHYNGKEYDYEIDARTGEVVKYETESAGTVPASSNTSAAAAEYIGESKAKQTALNHAGVSESDTSYCNVWLEYDDGRAECYEVEFMSGSTRYEYEIALRSATVLKYESKTYSNANSSHANQQTSSTSNDIGSEQAKAVALKDAGLQESSVTGLRVERDYDDGRLKYDVEFWSGKTEYDYTIDGTSGTIRDKDVEPHGSASSNTSSSASSATSSNITLEEAKAIALSHAGVNAANVFDMKAEQDYDDGKLEYEVEFKSGGMEYEYKLDSSGNIISYESDWD